MTTPTPRRSSLGMLLRRTKSSDLKKATRKVSKEQQAQLQQLQQQQQRDGVSKSPPRLPQLYNGAHAPQFDQHHQHQHQHGEQQHQQQQLYQSLSRDNRPDSVAIVSGRGHSIQPYHPSIDARFADVPVPPIPNGNWDPHSRAESMTHRGRYSYASSAMSTVNNPRRVRRRKDPTTFNILIVGSRSAGKTSFLEFLKSSLALPLRQRTKSTVEAQDNAGARARPVGTFIPHYIESEVDGERIGLTLWDSEGLEKNVVDLQLREMATFVESKFEETFNEEMKVVRSPGVLDTHIHAAFLILDPARLDSNVATAKKLTDQDGDLKYAKTTRLAGALDEDLDLQVLRTLQGKTTVIPIISKADTITSKHMAALKKSVWESLKAANIDPLQSLGLDDEAGDSDSRIDEQSESGSDDQMNGIGRADGGEHEQQPTSNMSKRRVEEPIEEPPLIPLSILSPDIYEPEIVGRQFPWGFADPYNVDHCDYLRLKEAVFSDWRGDLREVSKEQWYEGWRTSRLKHTPHRLH